MRLSSPPTTDGGKQESEAEKLLRKARQLASEAAADEEVLRASLCEKKSSRNAKTDAFIDKLFPVETEADKDDVDVVNRLRAKSPSTDFLCRVVERLHEREIAAKGLQHVESSSDTDHSQFRVVADPDEAELCRVEGLIDRIVVAAVTLDQERMARKSASGGEEGVVHHSEQVHWAAGNVGKILKDKVGDLRREHDDQFQKRQKSFYDAAKRKDKDKKSSS